MDVDRVDPEGNRQYFSGGPAVSCGQNLAQPCPFSPPCGDHLNWIEFQRSCVPQLRAQHRREQGPLEAAEGSRCSYCGECLVQWNNSFEEWLSECEAFSRETGVAPWWVNPDDDPMENDDDRDEDAASFVQLRYRQIRPDQLMQLRMVEEDDSLEAMASGFIAAEAPMCEDLDLDAFPVEMQPSGEDAVVTAENEDWQWDETQPHHHESGNLQPSGEDTPIAAEAEPPSSDAEILEGAERLAGEPMLAAQADNLQVVLYSAPESPPPPPPPQKSVGKRLDWREVHKATREGDLQDQAADWIRSKELHVGKLIRSTYAGKRALIARCAVHVSCPHCWCFSSRVLQVREDGDSDAREENFMIVEDFKECDGPVNLKGMQKHYAYVYAVLRKLTPDKARLQMAKPGPDQVPLGQRPSIQQLKDQRRHVPGKRRKGKHYSAVCVGALERFLQENHDTMHVFHEHTVVSKEEIRIAFCSISALTDVQTSNMQCFVMDFTFNTNVEGLLLGAAGPVGLVIEKEGGLPHMRCFPQVFMLSHAEDEDAHKILLDLLFSLRSETDVAFTDGFLDCHCYNSAKKHYGHGWPWTGIIRIVFLVSSPTIL